MSVLSSFRKLKSKLAKVIYSGSYPAGHFYNPIPSLKYVKENEAQIFNEASPSDIDLNADEQLQFLRDTLSASRLFSFPLNQTPGFRYYSANGYFNETDALGIFLILTRYRSKRIIEVGSGFSSACILDIYDRHMDYSPQLTFIEPNAERLKSLITGSDMNKCDVIEKFVQQVETTVFRQLNEHDILFIDSSHISKAGSDLNYLLFEVLPILKKGVIIHFHDICYPFEYPKEWIYDGIYWNEAYLLRAFLMNNRKYKILLFNDFVAKHHRSWLDGNIPHFLWGGSLWLQKLED